MQRRIERSGGPRVTARWAVSGFVLASVLVAAGLAAVAADPPAPGNEESRTAAAVIAVDRHWGAAVQTADNAYLDDLLLTEYRSVDADGTSHGKSKVPRKPLSEVQLSEREVWTKSHPREANVVISGDTAVLTWYDPTLGPERGIRSCDVFVYQGGRWHALYSQHSDLSSE